MKNSLMFAAVALLAASPVLAEAAVDSVQVAPVAARGKMLNDANGGRLAPVMHVNADGSAQIIYQGRVVNVPSSTLSVVDGKLTTSLKKNDVLALR